MVERNFRDPVSLPPKERDAYHLISSALLCLVQTGWDVIEVNAFIMGMCRSSMEDIVGVDEANKLDNEWRNDIGWK